MIPYILFLIASVAVIVMPGPNLLCILGTAIEHGWKKAYSLAVGTAIGVYIWVGLIAYLISKINCTPVQDIFRVGGMAYIGLLAVRCFGDVYHTWLRKVTKSHIRDGGYFKMLTRGILFSLANPITLMFLIAFLPQFIDGKGAEAENYLMELGGWFTGLVLIIDWIVCRYSSILAHYFIGSKESLGTKWFSSIVLTIVTCLLFLLEFCW